MNGHLRALVIAVLMLLGLGGATVAAQAQTPEANGVIAFERLNPGTGDRDIYQVGLDGAQPQLLWSGGENPRWSPNGSQLAFLTCLDPPTCDTAVALLDPATGAVQGFRMPDPDIFTACVVWTPVGDRLACEGQGQSDPALNGVYTIRSTDGEGLTRVTVNPNGDDSPLDYSPDGSRLLFARSDPARPSGANQALFVAAADGRNAHRITPWGFTDDQASWSPSGRLIVFGTGGSLYRIRPDGTGLTKISLSTGPATQRATAFDVTWSPDGTRIVFSLRVRGAEQPGLYTAAPDGSQVQRVTTSPTGDHHASWGAASGG